MKTVLTFVGNPMDNSIKTAVVAGNFDILVRLLADLLDGSYYVADDGNLVRGRQQVAKIRGMTVSIYGKEHAPPHFHVHDGDGDYRFALEDCHCMNKIDASRRKLIEHWYRLGKPLLIKVWNDTRPDGCTVGRYRES